MGISGRCSIGRRSWSTASVSTSRRSEEHTSELQSPCNLVCRLLLEKKKDNNNDRKQPYQFGKVLHAVRLQRPIIPIRAHHQNNILHIRLFRRLDHTVETTNERHAFL